MLVKYPEEGIYFTSDTHFGHENIIRFCNRPFNSIEEHDKTLIDNWNSIISPDDTVFHLGDFAFGGYPFWKTIREQLNGHIILIIGNHDWKNLTAGSKSLFDECVSQARISINGQIVYLNHFPFLCFSHSDPKYYGKDYSIQLFGHIHSGPNATGTDTSRSSILYPTQYDVGVDNNNFMPLSWKEIKEKIDQNVLRYNQIT